MIFAWISLVASFAYARVVFFGHADAFVTDRGRLHQWVDDPYVIQVDQVGDRLWLSGFGMKNERVRLYATPRFADRPNLVFVSDDPRSTRRPRLVFSDRGFATLFTTRLTAGRLGLSMMAEVSRTLDVAHVPRRGLRRRDPCERRLL